MIKCTHGPKFTTSLEVVCLHHSAVSSYFEGCKGSTCASSIMAPPASLLSPLSSTYIQGFQDILSEIDFQVTGSRAKEMRRCDLMKKEKARGHEERRQGCAS